MLESRKRREHLSLDDLQKNKAILESFTKGGNFQSFDQNGEVRYVCRRYFKVGKGVERILPKTIIILKAGRMCQQKYFIKMSPTNAK